MSETVLAHPLLVASLADCPIVAREGYDYFVHPLADGIPAVEPVLLHEAAAGLATHLNASHQPFDLLVTAEAMGLPLVAAVSARMGVPYVTVRKRAYGLPGEVAVAQRTGYSEATLHLNGVAPGTRAAIVDDVISTGGTLRALAGGIRRAGAELTNVVAVFSKDPDLNSLARELACPVSALVTCQVTEHEAGAKAVELVATDVTGRP